MAVARASELAALYVPVAAPHDVSALPYLRYSPTTAFQASAIVASAIDTALLPPRLTGGRPWPPFASGQAVEGRGLQMGRCDR